MNYEEYEFRYLLRLRERVRKLVKQSLFENEDRAYIHQAHHNLEPDLGSAQLVWPIFLVP